MAMRSTNWNVRIAFAILTLIAVGLCTARAQAQTIVDVAKITCEQFLTFKVADPKDISIWLSGYFHGRQADTRLYPQQLSENFSKLKSQCFMRENSKRNVLEVAETLFMSRK
jgi:acid stress chaperone HdeB